MRNIVSLSLTAALLSAGLALIPAAQAADSSQTGTPLTGRKGSFSNATNASDIIGKTAYSSAGESIGSINDLLVDNHGRVQAAVVDVGGFLGMGSHTVAIDWNQLKINPSNDRVTVGMSKDQLRSAPEYSKSAQANINAPQSSQTPPEKQR